MFIFLSYVILLASTSITRSEDVTQYHAPPPNLWMCLRVVGRIVIKTRTQPHLNLVSSLYGILTLNQFRPNVKGNFVGVFLSKNLGQEIF